MLSRPQVYRLSQEGRQLAVELTASLTQHEEIVRAESDAFAKGRAPELRDLRNRRSDLEDRTLTLRSQLQDLSDELASHAARCAREYRDEVGRDTPAETALPLAPRRTSDDIHDFLKYVEAVETAVNLITARITAFRRNTLSELTTDLGRLLLELSPYNDDLPAVREYLQSESFLDLTLVDARRRLTSERLLLEKRLQHHEDQRRRDEIRAQLSRSRIALARLLADGTLSDNDLPSDLSNALALLRHGELEDLQLFWRFASRSFARLPAPAQQVIDSEILALLVTCLDAASESPPFVVLDEVSDALCERIQTAPLTVERLATSIRDRNKVLDDAFVTRLVQLKQRVPIVSFLLLKEFVSDRISSGAVASWYLAAPYDWATRHLSVEWLSVLFERRGLWREAFACLTTLPASNTNRQHALLIAAIAEQTTAFVIPEEAWWRLTSPVPGFFSSPSLATVVAVATLIVGCKTGSLHKEVLLACRSALHNQPALAQLIDTVSTAWPASPTAALAHIDNLLSRRQELQDRVESFLRTVKMPAGVPSREFYRDVVLPHLNGLYRKGGAASLATLPPDTVAELLSSHRVSLNPVAVQATARLVSELQRDAEGLHTIHTQWTAGQHPEGTAQLFAQIREEEAHLAATDMLLSWAYSRARELLTAELPGEPITDSSSAVRELLFRSNPLIDTGETDLLRAALHEVIHWDDLEEWRIRWAVEHHAFQFADRYLSLVPPSRYDVLQTYVQKAFEKVRDDLSTDLALAGEFLSAIEEGSETEVVDMCLTEARTALELRDPVAARRWIEDAITECGRLEREQAAERSGLKEDIRELLDISIRQLLSGQSAHAQLSQLVKTTLDVIASDKVRSKALRPFIEALRQATRGAMFDMSLIQTAAAGTPASADLEPPEPPMIPRPPVSFEVLPRLVRSELEYMVGSVGAASVPTDDHRAAVAGRPSAVSREEAAITLFIHAWKQRGDWEQALIAFLEERARRALTESAYVRSGEYYLAACQVAYYAASRSAVAIQRARFSAFQYGVARLLRLQMSSALQLREPRPHFGASHRDWVNLSRDYLLARGAVDLADVLATLLDAVPDLAPEFFELACAELPALRAALLRALLDELESLSTAKQALLYSLSSFGAPLADHELLKSFVELVCDVATVNERDAEFERRIASLLSDTDSIPTDEEQRRLYRDTLLRLQVGSAPLPKATAVEANVTAVTKDLYLDALTDTSPLPLHLRISLSPDGALLRDVVITLRTDHSDLDILPTHRSLEIPWLRGGTPREITSYVQRRNVSDDARLRTSSGDLTLEVADIGLRAEGVVIAGTIPFKGRRLTIGLRNRYPHSGRPNPYSPGPVITDPALIKGRDEEARSILRTLRGAYQDNVPLIWGSRRIGKSTLLYKLRLDPDVRRHYEAVVCDMEGLVRQHDNTPRFVARLANHINAQLQGSRAGRILAPDLSRSADALDGFQTYLNRVGEACGARSLLIMFDEMELFFDTLREQRVTHTGQSYDTTLHDDIVHLLRHNMQHNRKVSFLLAGTKRLVDIAGEAGERFFHLPVPLQLGELRDPEALALIEEPTSDVFSYSSGARRRLLQLTARHPYLLQAVCHEVFSSMQDRHASVCSEAELEEILRDRVLAQPSYFDFQVRPLRRTPEALRIALAIAGLTLEERRTDTASILARLELQGVSIEPNVLEAIVHDLVDSGVLTEWRGRDQFRFRFPIVGLYVAQAFGGTA